MWEAVCSLRNDLFHLVVCMSNVFDSPFLNDPPDNPWFCWVIYAPLHRGLLPESSLIRIHSVSDKFPLVPGLVWLCVRRSDVRLSNHYCETCISLVHECNMKYLYRCSVKPFSVVRWNSLFKFPDRKYCCTKKLSILITWVSPMCPVD